MNLSCFFAVAASGLAVEGLFTTSKVVPQFGTAKLIYISPILIKHPW
jgi:hypothetical protein